MVGGGYTELLIKSAVRPHWMGYIQWVLRWVMGGRLGLIDRDVWVTRQAPKDPLHLFLSLSIYPTSD